MMYNPNRRAFERSGTNGMSGHDLGIDHDRARLQIEPCRLSWAIGGKGYAACPPPFSGRFLYEAFPMKLSEGNMRKLMGILYKNEKGTQMDCGPRSWVSQRRRFGSSRYLYCGRTRITDPGKFISMG